MNNIEQILLQTDSSEHLVGAMHIFRNIRNSNYELTDFTRAEIGRAIRGWERYCKDVTDRAKPTLEDGPVIEKDPHQENHEVFE